MLINAGKDIYFDKDFCDLSIIKSSELFRFKYEEKDWIFKSISIKKPILNIAGVAVTDGYYDLESPYGYAGYYINTNDSGFIFRAMESYFKRCKEEKVVAEYLRFHPFISTQDISETLFDFFEIDRKVVVVDLQQNKESRWANYSTTTRNILRKCIKNDLSFKESDDYELFKSLYKNTMLRNQANESYYFTDDYFSKIFQRLDVKLFKVSYKNKTLAMSIVLFGPELVHYHLSANSLESLNLNANYYLLDKVFDYATELKKKFMLLGGGRTNHLDDSLFKFKKKFSPEFRDFVIAGKVFNQRKYEEYCKIWKKNASNPEQNYFLKYRLKNE
jgi:hypothetical protein